MSKFVNLTPHDLHVYDREGNALLLTIPASGQSARVREETEWDPDSVSAPAGRHLPEDSPVPIGYRFFGSQLDWLPPQAAGTAYVVSLLAGLAMTERRDDVFVPGPEVRDGSGRIIGCAGLAVAVRAPQPLYAPS